MFCVENMSQTHNKTHQTDCMQKLKNADMAYELRSGDKMFLLIILTI